MTDSPPAPPTDLPESLVEPLGACSPAQLRDVGEYAAALAAYREQEARRAAPDEEPTPEEPPEDLPDDVPSKATTTVKTINENRYVYWQWREGEQIKSKYKGPATSDE